MMYLSVCVNTTAVCV